MVQGSNLTDIELVSRLTKYLAAQGAAGPVSDLTPLKLGWESRVFAARVEGAAVPSQILRLYYGADGGATALREFRGLNLLYELGYPVPQPLLVEPSARPLGSPFLMMEQAPGRSPGAQVFAQERAEDRHFVEAFCGLLARLHTLDWAHGSAPSQVQTVSIDDQLHGWALIAQRHQVATAQPALTWLTHTRAQVNPLPLALVHWDYHHENLLMDGQGQATVIDWTQFQATDARFDLAWTLTLVRSYAGDRAAARVLAGYEAALPARHALRDQDNLAWFEAAACAKRLLSVMIALKHGAAALGMRPGAEASIVQGFGALAQVYRRWLALTQVDLPDVADLLADHL